MALLIHASALARRHITELMQKNNRYYSGYSMPCKSAARILAGRLAQGFVSSALSAARVLTSIAGNCKRRQRLSCYKHPQIFHLETNRKTAFSNTFYF